MQNTLVLKDIVVSKGSLFMPEKGLYVVDFLFSSIPEEHKDFLYSFSYLNYYGVRVITFRNTAISYENVKRDLLINDRASIILYKNNIKGRVQFRLVHLKIIG